MDQRQNALLLIEDGVDGFGLLFPKFFQKNLRAQGARLTVGFDEQRDVLVKGRKPVFEARLADPFHRRERHLVPAIGRVVGAFHPIAERLKSGLQLRRHAVFQRQSRRVSLFLNTQLQPQTFPQGLKNNPRRASVLTAQSFNPTPLPHQTSQNVPERVLAQCLKDLRHGRFFACNQTREKPINRCFQQRFGFAILQNAEPRLNAGFHGEAPQQTL